MIKLHRKFIKREPWFTRGLLVSSIRKAKLLKKKLKRQSPESINKYRIYCSIFNKIKRAAKVKYYTEMLNTHKHDIKETWKIMRHAMRKQPGIMKRPQTFVINGHEVSHSKYRAYCRTV